MWPSGCGGAATFTTASAVIGPIQAGVDRLAFGVLLRGRGVVRTTGYSLIDVSVSSPRPSERARPVRPAAEPDGAFEPHRFDGLRIARSAGENIFKRRTADPGRTAEGSARKEEPLPSRCEGLAVEEAPSEQSLPEAPSTEPLSVTGKWTVRAGTDHARTVHAVLLQNGKLLLMAGSGNSRMEFEAGCFRSYVYNPVANTWKELQTPSDLFCGGHVQLADGNVLFVGGTKGYPPPPKPGEYPSTVYKGANASWIFNIKTEGFEKVPYDELEPHQPKEPGPLLSGAWYPSATELGDGNVISFGGLNEEGEGATATNYYIAPYNKGDTAGDPSGQWVGFGSDELQQTYDWFWGLYPSMILTADGRLFYDGSHVFGNGLRGIEVDPGDRPRRRTPRRSTTSTAPPANRSRKKTKNRTTPIRKPRSWGRGWREDRHPKTKHIRASKTPLALKTPTSAISRPRCCCPRRRRRR